MVRIVCCGNSSVHHVNFFLPATILDPQQKHNEIFLKQVPFQLKLEPQISYHLEIFSIDIAFSFKLGKHMYFDTGEKMKRSQII